MPFLLFLWLWLNSPYRCSLATLEFSFHREECVRRIPSGSTSLRVGDQQLRCRSSRHSTRRISSKFRRSWNLSSNIKQSDNDSQSSKFPEIIHITEGIIVLFKMITLFIFYPDKTSNSPKVSSAKKKKKNKK